MVIDSKLRPHEKEVKSTPRRHAAQPFEIVERQSGCVRKLVGHIEQVFKLYFCSPSHLIKVQIVHLAAVLNLDHSVLADFLRKPFKISFDNKVREKYHIHAVGIVRQQLFDSSTYGLDVMAKRCVPVHIHCRILFKSVRKTLFGEESPHTRIKPPRIYVRGGYSHEILYLHLCFIVLDCIATRKGYIVAVRIEEGIQRIASKRRPYCATQFVFVAVLVSEYSFYLCLYSRPETVILDRIPIFGHVLLAEQRPYNTLVVVSHLVFSDYAFDDLQKRLFGLVVGRAVYVWVFTDGECRVNVHDVLLQRDGYAVDRVGLIDCRMMRYSAIRVGYVLFLGNQ